MPKKSVLPEVIKQKVDILDYKDQYNNERTLEETFELNVLSAEEYARTHKGSSTRLYAGAVIVLLVGYYFFKRRHKKR